MKRFESIQTATERDRAVAAHNMNHPTIDPRFTYIVRLNEIIESQNLPEELILRQFVEGTFHPDSFGEYCAQFEAAGLQITRCLFTTCGDDNASAGWELEASGNAECIRKLHRQFEDEPLKFQVHHPETDEDITVAVDNARFIDVRQVCPKDAVSASTFCRAVKEAGNVSAMECLEALRALSYRPLNRAVITKFRTQVRSDGTRVIEARIAALTDRGIKSVRERLERFHRETKSRLRLAGSTLDQIRRQFLFKSWPVKSESAGAVQFTSSKTLMLN
jgi:hypothetical protein